MLRLQKVKNKNETKQSLIMISACCIHFRLTATLVTVMLICTKYLPEMNSGPMWNMVIGRHSELCYENWWRNLLYIQNLFGFMNMVKMTATDRSLHAIYHLSYNTFEFKSGD